jgi:hypothetical protein
MDSVKAAGIMWTACIMSAQGVITQLWDVAGSWYGRCTRAEGSVRALGNATHGTYMHHEAGTCNNHSAT